MRVWVLEESMNSEKLHEVGVHRHGDRWFHANRRAIEAASAAGLKYYGAIEMIAIPSIVLKVLDGQMLDTGFVWSREGDKWIPRVAVEVAKRLTGQQDDN